MRRYTTRFIEIIVINVEKKKGKKSKEGHTYINSKRFVEVCYSLEPIFPNVWKKKERISFGRAHNSSLKRIVVGVRGPCAFQLAGIFSP